MGMATCNEELVCTLAYGHKGKHWPAEEDPRRDKIIADLAEMMAMFQVLTSIGSEANTGPWTEPVATRAGAGLMIIENYQAQLDSARRHAADWAARLDAMCADLESQGFVVERFEDNIIIKTSPPEIWHTPSEAAKLLGICNGTLIWMARKGYIRFERKGRRWRYYPQSEIDRLRRDHQYGHRHVPVPAQDSQA